MIKAGVIVILAIIHLAIFFGPGHAAVTCGQVDAALMQCVTYLTGHGGDPSPACCAGVQAVRALAQTTEDKRACCNCVKSAANRYTDLNDGAAQSLPGKCNVRLDIPVSRTVDCDKIN